MNDLLMNIPEHGVPYYWLSPVVSGLHQAGVERRREELNQPTGLLMW